MESCFIPLHTWLALIGVKLNFSASGKGSVFGDQYGCMLDEVHCAEKWELSMGFRLSTFSGYIIHMKIGDSGTYNC